MANVSRDDVLKLARLARLRLTDEETDQFTSEIQEILNYVEQLDLVETDGLMPTYQVTGLTNVTRPDLLGEYSAKPDDLLRNAPDKEGSQIKVKRMLT